MVEECECGELSDSPSHLILPIVRHLLVIPLSQILLGVGMGIGIACVVMIMSRRMVTCVGNCQGMLLHFGVWIMMLIMCVLVRWLEIPEKYCADWV